jgi:hypothetical protein
LEWNWEGRIFQVEETTQPKVQGGKAQDIFGEWQTTPIG